MPRLTAMFPQKKFSIFSLVSPVLFFILLPTETISDLSAHRLVEFRPSRLISEGIEHFNPNESVSGSELHKIYYDHHIQQKNLSMSLNSNNQKKRQNPPGEKLSLRPRTTQTVYFVEDPSPSQPQKSNSDSGLWSGPLNSENTVTTSTRSKKTLPSPQEDGLNLQTQPEGQESQGRIYSAGGGLTSPGWSGYPGGGVHCQNLQSYNPGCCQLGFSNCCGSGGGVHFPRPPGNAWGSKPFPKPHPQPIHHHVHHPRPQIILPPRPPPVLPPVYIPRPPPPRPIIHHHHPKPHPLPIGGSYQKPGSCFYKPSLSFLSKLNPFTKVKELGSSLFNKGGWGWGKGHPPSQNAGYHFYKRADHGQKIMITKRQLNINGGRNLGDTGEFFFNDEDSYGKGDGKGNFYNRDSYSYTDENNNQRGEFSENKHGENIQESRFGPNSYSNHPIEGGGGFQQDNYYNDNNNQGQYDGLGFGNVNYGDSSSNYIQDNRYEGDNEDTVGIGSITGRIFGALGWNKGITTGWTVASPKGPCHSDYECPGIQKCCAWICKTPSFN